MRRRWPLVLVATLAILGASAPVARADGDPGSDVLVYQPLFLASDSGVSIAQQARLGALLAQAQRGGMPVRVAIIASRFDLGAVTALWHEPRAYARFLGLELSLSYRGRLLVVMPNGLGFNWPGHAATAAYRTLARIAIGPGGAGLAAAARSAIVSLAAAGGVRLRAPAPASSTSAGAPGAPGAAGSGSGGNGAAAGTAGAGGPGTGASGPGGSATDTEVAVIAFAALAATGLGLLTRRLLERRRRRRTPRLRFGPRPRTALTAALVASAGAALATVIAIGSPSATPGRALASNPNLDPGTPVSRPAPGFTLTDQFGRPVSLRSFRGRVVLLAFNDSECTTICPLTTAAMLDAQRMLGAAGARVQLLGIDANPKATSLEDVLSYSQLHGMLHAWHFLTGSLPQLRRVWKAYGIQAAVLGGQIAHTPALFAIGPDGRLAKVYLTQQSYAAIGQLGQLLAQEASDLLPDHPRVRTDYGYSEIAGIGPRTTLALPRFGGGSVRLGPGRPRLYLFFATWDREITTLAGELEALGAYSRAAARAGAPALTALDEASVEPSPAALHQFLAALRRPLAYPVGVDASGRVADGYQVQGEPWFVLTSASGRIIWFWQVATSGWLSSAALLAHVRAALARAPAAPSGLDAVRRELAASPPELAALHRQAGRLLGNATALLARARALRGYPLVINAWASWCGPCQAESGLFASASAHYGVHVAFLGADAEDTPGSAESFLAQHPVSYPSYQTSMTGLDALVPQGLADLPTTIFVSRAGRLVYVHIGQYQSQGALDADIQNYALGG